MRHLHFLTVLSVVAACDTATPKYAGQEVTRVEVGQSTFDVRQRGDKAQAIRINSEWAPNPASVVPRALSAIEQVTGCNVVRWDGDQVVIEARLDCGPDAQLISEEREIICDVWEIYDDTADIRCKLGI